jgi:hypothetical protein
MPTGAMGGENTRGVHGAGYRIADAVQAVYAIEGALGLVPDVCEIPILLAASQY